MIQSFFREKNLTKKHAKKNFEQPPVCEVALPCNYAHGTVCTSKYLRLCALSLCTYTISYDAKGW